MESLRESKSIKHKPLGKDLTFLKNGSELTIPLLSDTHKNSINSLFSQNSCQSNLTHHLKSHSQSRKESVFEAIEESDELKNTLTSKNSSVMLSNLKLTKISDSTTNPEFSKHQKNDPDAKSNTRSATSSCTPQKIDRLTKRSEE
jgi:hypothetical protein